MKYLFPEERPDWQEERGERYGNNRKSVAKEKRMNRRLRKVKEKREAMKGWGF